MSVNVRKLDCDFYALSGHKMYGPTGIGVLHGKAGAGKIPPYQGGGDMINPVTFEKTTYALPYKFEAGTPNVAGAVGLGAAIDYMQELGIEAVPASRGTRRTCWLCHGTGHAGPRLADSSAPRPTARGRSPSLSTTSHRHVGRRHDVWMTRASPFARAIIAPAGSWSARHPGDRAGGVGVLQHA